MALRHVAGFSLRCNPAFKAEAADRGVSAIAPDIFMRRAIGKMLMARYVPRFDSLPHLVMEMDQHGVAGRLDQRDGAIGRLSVSSRIA